MASVYSERDGIYSSTRPKLNLPSDSTMGVVEFFEHNTSMPEIGHKAALIDAITGEEVSFGKMKCLYSSIAAGLIELGIGRGDVVLILSPNSIHFPLIFFAVISIGAIVTTVNPLNTSGEISKQAKDSATKIVFTVVDLLDKMTMLPEIPIILIDSEDVKNSQVVSSLTKLMLGNDRKGRASRVKIRSKNDTAALLYSSGTTGISKGVMLSHLNFIAAGVQVNIDAAIEGRKDEIVLCMLPMFHIFGLAVTTFATLQRGGTVVVMPRFEFVQLLKSIQRYKVTQLPLVPPVVIALVKQPIVDEYDVSSLLNIICGAAPLGKEIMEECRRRLPHVDVRQGYGLTESTGMSLLAPANEGSKYLGSAGTLVSGTEAMVIDMESGKPLPPNKHGELWVRGPHIMKGYLNNPEATASTLDNEGWLHTGDLVYVNDDGRVYVMERIKELIKYKGFQVAPAELEALLLSHPLILDAAVVPLADDEAGEVPIAFVVRDPNTNLSQQQVIKFVADQVAPYKKLRRVSFITAIPKSPAGKILRRQLTQKNSSVASKL